MKKKLRRVYYGTFQGIDDIRYRYQDESGNLHTAKKAPKICEFKRAERLPTIDMSPRRGESEE